MEESEVTRLLGQDLSTGTDAFRDALLARCLKALIGQGDELDDEGLGMLAAAGNPLDVLPDHK